MAQHTNVPPMTAAERKDYARKCWEMADRMRQDGDLFSAAINTWMAERYSKPKPEME